MGINDITATSLLNERDEKFLARIIKLFGDEKDVQPGEFRIIGIEYKPSILTSIKNLLNF